jgi:molecular chaperone IbpA
MDIAFPLRLPDFQKADLEIEVKEKTLNVSAHKPKAEDNKTYLHRGIATRAFERQFHLADHVRAGRREL